MILKPRARREIETLPVDFKPFSPCDRGRAPARLWLVAALILVAIWLMTALSEWPEPRPSIEIPGEEFDDIEELLRDVSR